MRHQEPTRRRAGGSILPHKPGNWQTADGQVHFPSGVSGLRYGRATPFRDGGGRDVDCSMAGGDAAGWSRERAHGGPRYSPPPVRFASECCAISPFASSAGVHCARGHRPRPPTSGHREGGRWARGSGGGRGLNDVGGKGMSYSRIWEAKGGTSGVLGPRWEVLAFGPGRSKPEIGPSGKHHLQLP